MTNPHETYQPMFMIGYEVRDVYTGVAGIISSIHLYPSRASYTIELKPDKDNTSPVTLSMDEERLTYVNDGVYAPRQAKRAVGVSY